MNRYLEDGWIKSEYIFYKSINTQWSVGFTKRWSTMKFWLIPNTTVSWNGDHGFKSRLRQAVFLPFLLYYKNIAIHLQFFICRLVLFLAGIFNFVFHVDPWTCSVSNIKINLGGEFEPATSWLQIRCSTNWANQADSPGQYADFWNRGGGNFRYSENRGANASILKMPIWGPKLGI